VRILSAILSLLIAIAGWHYLFYSVAAIRLAGVEDERRNRLRNALRRVGGIVMLLLAGCFFAGFWTFDFSDLERDSDRFAMIWVAVALLITAIIVLALIDLHLTAKLRRATKSIDETTL